ncbi:MAG: hypothetical protein NC087_05810 [Anaeroplasma bactoclasticum]|nr:hypothetical protein [Anaeroplasma bactoclasticum]MCM1557033.1 hypothetical protein [Anaeroplasma bactoclasticum]
MKKIFISFIIGIFLLIPLSASADSVNPEAYGIQVGSDWEFNRYEKKTFNVQVNNKEDYTIGIVSFDAFLYKCIKQSDCDYYLIAYKLTITPKVSKKKYNWFYNYYGWSEYFEVSSQLPENARLTNYSPKTENPKNSYTVGINGGYSSENGLSAGISASISGISSTLKINCQCDTPSRLFKIGYDYLCDAAHDNDYLKKETIQYGMFTVELPKGTSYTPTFKVMGKFAPAIGWSSFFQVAVTDRVENYVYVTM